MIVLVSVDNDGRIETLPSPGGGIAPAYKSLDIDDQVLHDFIMGSAGGRHSVQLQRRLDECSDIIRAAYKVAP